jgi:SHS2 domain-containing protein
MFEFFEHTADLGLRVRAATLNELFAEAGRALFAALLEVPDGVAPAEEVRLEVAGDELDYLLFDWLKELLYRFDADHMLFCRFEVEVDKEGLKARAWGEPLDRARHELGHEVKAITYHGLRVEQEGGGWLAELIVDI